jgi:hypothetical protein
MSSGSEGVRIERCEGYRPSRARVTSVGLPFGGGRRHRARSLIGRVINSAITVLTRSRIPLAEARFSDSVPARRSRG